MTAVAVTNALVSAPLPTIIEKLGIAVAQAQNALDKNSVAVAAEMAESTVAVGSKEYNLISLGFTPAFYAFTEATVEAKLSFTMQQETSIGVSGSVTVRYAFVAATVSASYARKFSVETSGSSSIAARLVSVPPPTIFQELLEREFRKEVE
jgi:hypothetical protein